MLRSFNSIVARRSSAMVREYQKAGGIRVERRDQNRVTGRFPIHPFLSVNRLGLRRF
jgi:hypothetical protein